MTRNARARSAALARAAAERAAKGLPPKMVRGRKGIWIPGEDKLPLQDIHPALYRNEEQEGRALWTLVQAGALGGVAKRWLFHIPNGGGRSSVIEGAALKAQGVRKGPSDYLLPVAIGKWHGLWIELKAVDGSPTEEQLEWIVGQRFAGYCGCFAYGADAACEAIRLYMQGEMR